MLSVPESPSVGRYGTVVGTAIGCSHVKYVTLLMFYQPEVVLSTIR